MRNVYHSMPWLFLEAAGMNSIRKGLFRRPVDTLERILAESDKSPLQSAVDDLLCKGAVLQWHRYDDDDQSTLPQPGAFGILQPVLAMSVSTQLDKRKANGQPAPLFVAYYGSYEVCEDGVLRFLLDAGNAYLDEIGEEGEDWIEPPPLWTYIMDPDEAGVMP